jgi:hypothetical protein
MEGKNDQGGRSAWTANPPPQTGRKRRLFGEMTDRCRRVAGGMLLLFGKEHVAWWFAAATTVVKVENEIVFEDEILDGIAQFTCRTVDGIAGAFELDKGADGSFVELDEEALGPRVAGGEFVGGTEFLIAKPASEPEAFKDSLKRRSIAEDHLDFFANLVVTVRWGRGGSDGELFGWGFEGEQGPRSGILLCEGRSLGADAQELTVLGESAIGGVEDHIQFVSAGDARRGADFGEKAKEGFGVIDFELDFCFARHGEKITGRRDGEKERGGLWVTLRGRSGSDSIASEESCQQDVQNQTRIYREKLWNPRRNRR